MSNMVRITPLPFPDKRYHELCPCRCITTPITPMLATRNKLHLASLSSLQAIIVSSQGLKTIFVLDLENYIYLINISIVE